METIIVSTEGVFLQVPWTYRGEPLDGADDALNAEMHHTALGTRCVYDGLGDDRFITMAASVAIDLRYHRLPVTGPQPDIGLTATWPGQTNAVVLIEVAER